MVGLMDIARFAFTNWAPISGLMANASKAVDAINAADPNIIPQMKADIVALIQAIDPMAVAVAAKVSQGKELSDDERRWMDRASGWPSSG
jgi:hypothetical protein